MSVRIIDFEKGFIVPEQDVVLIQQEDAEIESMLDELAGRCSASRRDRDD